MLARRFNTFTMLWFMALLAVASTAGCPGFPGFLHHGGGEGDTTAPTVTSANPANGATGVALNQIITAAFSEAVDPSTITTATFTLTGPDATSVPATVTFDDATNIATLTPSSTLAPDTTFAATIAGVTDLAGNALEGDFAWSFTTGASTGQAPVALGSASTFVVLAGSAVSNTGATIVNGDLGVSPSATVNGFPPGAVNGTIHAADPSAAQAKLDLTAAFLDAQGRSVGSQTLPGNLGGLTFTPGLYTNSTSVLISGSGPGNNVTLDAQGDANAVFIFQMGSTLTTGPGSQVILSGGAKASNVYWQVGTSATLDTTSVFKGNILAQTSITLNTGATLDGRALAQNGAVTLDSNTITTPVP